MASVYKSLSKKKNKVSASHDDAENIDVSMDDLPDHPDETSDSDDYENEDERYRHNGVGGSVESKSQSVPSGYMPKTRVLMLTSRGVTHRYVKGYSGWLTIESRSYGVMSMAEAYA